jgi:hypothetical protein
MRNSPLSPCPGCGALFPEHDGPVHRYIGASAGCWALFSWSKANGATGVAELVEQSRIPDGGLSLPVRNDAPLIGSLWGDAYGVQHHGGESPQAVQSVAVHLLDLHGIISGKTTRPGWAIERALRVRGVFQKLSPPRLGSALTFRHLFSGGGVSEPVTRGQYVISVYEAWMALHRATIEHWFERYVVPDETRDTRSRRAP